ncbi:MAG: helix-turn-helix transcriptional regulator [Bacteroidetes bacterium]|nr:helix-turn-helix transcriptional regulator [Bacteroidota bacterium]
MVVEFKELKYKGKRAFEKLVMTTDFKRIPKFFAADEACFLYLTKGSFQFRTPTSVVTYSKNEAMLAKCGDYFIEEPPVHEKSNETISAIGAFFNPEAVKELFDVDLSLSHFTQNFDVIKVNIQPLINAFISSIDFLLDNPAVADENLVRNKLKELLILLSKSENAASVNEFVSSLFVPFEYNFSEVIQKNLYTNLSLDELAKLCHCSLATFKRKFRAHYNESPARYISTKKLEKAVQLLQTRSMAIADIAYDCGFETIPNFNKAFKKQFGKSPGEYRLSQLDNDLSR